MLCRRADPGSMDHYPDHDPDPEMEEQKMRSRCYYDEVNRKIVYKAEYTLEELMEEIKVKEDQKMLLRKGQCFYDEKHQRFVTIAEKPSDRPYFDTNHIICFTHKVEVEGIEIEWLNRADILNMEFIQQESESYMKILEEEIHAKNREH